ncbi:MAG: hypothetical protein U9R50_11825 [Campylobacterota bacterium]|nr:hypothetical protein [Campylobacterota bacterium]
MENVEKKVIRNYDEMGYIPCNDNYKYDIKDKDIEVFKSRLQNEDAYDILEDMDISGVTNDYIMKDKDGNVFFLCSHCLDRVTEDNFDYVYNEDDKTLYTSEEYYNLIKENDNAVYIKYTNDWSRHEEIDNPFEFEYTDSQEFISLGHPTPYTNGVTAYFTDDEMVIEITSNYAEGTNEVITLDTFLNEYDDNLKEEVFLSEAAQELAKRDDVPEAFKKEIANIMKCMNKK